MFSRPIVGLTVFTLVAGMGRWSTALVAQESGGEGTPPPAAERKPTGAAVIELEWIAGHWRGEMFGGPVEEIWGAPRGGSMLGCCRLGDDGAKAMYEVLLIDEVEGVPTMFLLHYKSQLVARDAAPLRYALVKSAPTEATFETADTTQRFKRIVYRLDGKDTLVVRLEGERDGKPTAAEGRMKRVK